MNTPTTRQSTASISAWFRPRAQLENISVMTHLYNRLDGMYPNIWRANFKGAAAIDSWEKAWAEAFDEDGISMQMVADGLRACRARHDMPPSLPQFIKCCRATDDDQEKAFYIAADQMVRRHAGQPELWPSPRHFWAAQRVGGDMQHLSWRDLAGRWRAAWEQAAADVSRPIPAAVPPEQSLPAPGRTTRNEADVSRMLSEARDQVLAPRASKYPAGVDLSWTEKINDAPRNWPTISCRYAAEARAKFNLPVSDTLRKFLGTPQEVAA